MCKPFIRLIIHTTSTTVGMMSRQGGNITWMLMKPLVQCISPRRAEIRDDFPEPTAPTTATNRPGLISRDKLVITTKKDHIKKWICHFIYFYFLDFGHILLQQGFIVSVPGEGSVTNADSGAFGRKQNQVSFPALKTSGATTAVRLERTETAVVLHDVTVEVVAAQELL